MLQPCHGVVAVSSENREITNEDIARVIDAAQVDVYSTGKRNY